MTRTAKVLPQFLFFLLCLCTWSVTCVGQTNIPAGSVSGVWTKAGSPYIVNGDIAIDINQKLTIEAGSEVRFSGNYSLSVQGCLEAVGSASDSIRFTVTDNSGFSTNTHTGWHGIRFQNVTHPDSSAIVYCVLEYGKAGGGSESNNGGAIFSKGFGRIKIRNSTLRNNRSAYGGAIAVSGVSNLNLKDLLIRGNYASEDGGGIYSLTSNVTLSRSHIVNNNASQGGGIYIRTSSIMNINKTVIVGNKGGALEAFWQCQVNLDNTTAAGNTGLPDGFDIYLSDLNGKNSILWNKSNNNTYSEINDLDHSNVNLDYCIVKGVIDPEWIVSNSSTKDPKFINLPIFDAHLGWTGYPSKDATMSSAIDAGDPTNPHDPDGTIADIGALPFMQTSDAFPTVRFTADPIQGVIPLEVPFSNYSTQAAGEITSWKWSFGDNSISSEKEPVHHYTSPGTYDVKLVAQNEKGKKDSLTLTNYIKVLTGTIVDNPTVSGVWTKQGSPYNIYNSVTIPAGNTLTIEPGVEVVFFGPYTLNVNGNLLARGTAADSITFDRFDDKSSWHSIRIENVASDSDSTIFEYCRIAHTEYQGGNVTTNGGNAVLVKNFNKVRISNCLLRNNRGGRGAGVYVEKGDIKINNNVIRNNLVDQYGAGIYVDTGSPLIAGNRIEKNYGGSYAGGLWLSASKSRIENNIISYNNCYWYGAGLVITNGSDCTLLRNLVSYNESEHDDGGGISISGSSPSIVHNTIAFNKGEDGEGVLIKGTSYPNFVNTIIYGNRDRYQDANSTDEVYIESSNARPNFYNCAIQSGMGGIRGPFNGVAKNIISTSPLFANAAGNDFTLSWDNYPLADDSKSSCIDTGALDSPHDSDGSIADIGMQHFHQTLGKFSPRAEFTADTLLGYNELSVSFQDLSQKGSANITGWHWDFGDGSSSTEQNPIHEYTTEGRFDVTLTIKDVNGFERNIKKENYIRLIDGVYVKGNVSGIFDAPRYVVGGDIIVESANILEVKPGVEFMFMGSYELKVLGSLKAKGTAAKPIVFTSSDTTGLDLAHATTGYSEKLAGWKGIYVYASGSQDSTIIDHCKVQFVENNGRGAIYAFSNNGAAGMRISNSEVSYNSTQGIYVFATKLIIRNNYIHHNYARAYQKGAGIYFNAGSPKVINNIISNNQTADDGGGMCIDWDSRPSLIGNVVTHNKATRAGGICDYAGWIELINNTISFNVSTGSSGGGYYVL
ncbi:MAG: right-handed parallel beta-helix repeat-containing protein, partial [Cyclobacteriaceae bacterium]|nr:right-handed parallel beta-helix repeat-containing protein [Cyclobacteriaceae bacterium]